jgi:hypothetical protein
MAGLEFDQNFPGAVGRAVVDADQLNLERDGQDPRDHFPQGRLLVINGHDYGEFHGSRIDTLKG